MVSCGTPGCSCTPISYDVDFCPGCGDGSIKETMRYDYECSDCGWEGEIVPGDRPID